MVLNDLLRAGMRSNAPARGPGINAPQWAHVAGEMGPWPIQCSHLEQIKSLWAKLSSDYWPTKHWAIFLASLKPASCFNQKILTFSLLGGFWGSCGLWHMPLHPHMQLPSLHTLFLLFLTKDVSPPYAPPQSHRWGLLHCFVFDFYLPVPETN